MRTEMAEYINKTKFEELMRKKARSNFDLYYADKSKHYHDRAIGYNLAADEAHDFPSADVQLADRWISFKDKQPQEGGFYLTYYAEHIHVSQWFASKNWYNEHGGNVTNMVEYWQPLPEPPKDGDVE